MPFLNNGYPFFYRSARRSPDIDSVLGKKHPSDKRGHRFLTTSPVRDDMTERNWRISVVSLVGQLS